MPDQTDLFTDDQGRPRLPQPTTLTTMHNPFAVVLDMSFCDPEGKLVPQKAIRFYDRTNPGMAVEFVLDDTTMEKLAEGMTRRRSGLVKADAAALSKLPGLGG